MKIWTTRSGTVLHATRQCAVLRGVELFGLEEEDALAHALRCDRPQCRVAFLRAQEAKAA